MADFNIMIIISIIIILIIIVINNMMNLKAPMIIVMRHKREWLRLFLVGGKSSQALRPREFENHMANSWLFAKDQCTHTQTPPTVSLSIYLSQAWHISSLARKNADNNYAQKHDFMVRKKHKR